MKVGLMESQELTELRVSAEWLVNKGNQEARAKLGLQDLLEETDVQEKLVYPEILDQLAAKVKRARSEDQGARDSLVIKDLRVLLDQMVREDF